MKNSPSSASCPNRSYRLAPLTQALEFTERVRYSETDQMGVAHNKAYFEWFEVGRTEYCRRKNIPYRDIEARGYALVVAESFCRYRKPLRYDDAFRIRVGVLDMSAKKTVFGYEILAMNEDTLIAQGYTVHIAVDARGQVTSLPKDILEKFGRRGK